MALFSPARSEKFGSRQGLEAAALLARIGRRLRILENRLLCVGILLEHCVVRFQEFTLLTCWSRSGFEELVRIVAALLCKSCKCQICVYTSLTDTRCRITVCGET